MVVTPDGIQDALVWRRSIPLDARSMDNLVWSPALVIPKLSFVPPHRDNHNNQHLLGWNQVIDGDNVSAECIMSVLLRLKDCTDRWVHNAIVTSLVLDVACSVFKNPLVIALSPSPNKNVRQTCDLAVAYYRAMQTFIGGIRTRDVRPYNISLNDIVFCARFQAVYVDIVESHSAKAERLLLACDKSSLLEPTPRQPDNFLLCSSPSRFHSWTQHKSAPKNHALDREKAWSLTYTDICNNVSHLAMFTRHITVWSNILEYCRDNTTSFFLHHSAIVLPQPASDMKRMLADDLCADIISRSTLSIQDVVGAVESSCRETPCFHNIVRAFTTFDNEGVVG